MKKCIIWDFDGVIADSEKLCVGIWADMLKEFKGINLTHQQVVDNLVGVSHKTKVERMQKMFNGLVFEPEYIAELNRRKAHAFQNIMEVSVGVEEIVKNQNYAQCIASGGSTAVTEIKLKSIGFEKYFNKNNCFTSDMVQHGKPAPELFLLAAQTMGFAPQDCVVIEDAPMGLRAAQTAGITAIAYLGAEGNDRPEYVKLCEAEKPHDICFSMFDVARVLAHDRAHDYLSKSKGNELQPVSGIPPFNNEGR